MRNKFFFAMEKKPIFSFQYEKSANSHYSLKLRILFAMDRFQRWLGEIGNSIKKTEEFKKNIMKIFGGNQIENEFGIGNLEKEFDEILKERMGAKNANDFNSILRTLNDQLEFHNGIKMTELGAAERWEIAEFCTLNYQFLSELNFAI
jgi:hypothetical protein